MASTYNSIKVELIGSGDQAGAWGSTTNTNLGTALTEAITGSTDVVFASADVTLTLSNTNLTQPARHLRLNLTGVSGGARNLIVPAIQKQYLIKNNLADAITVKNSSGTGIAVPSGSTIGVFNDATNVVASFTGAYASVNGLTMATARILGRTTASTGAAEEITVGSGLSLTAGTLTATATSGISAGQSISYALVFGI